MRRVRTVGFPVSQGSKEGRQRLVWGPQRNPVYRRVGVPSSPGYGHNDFKAELAPNVIVNALKRAIRSSACPA